MNPTKEELDAIESWLSMYPMAKGQTDAISTILTRYRDGELVEKDRWISVKDMLPGNTNPVLILSDKTQEVGFYTKGFEVETEDEDGDGDWYDADDLKGILTLKRGWYVDYEQGQSQYDSIFFGRNVTHWQPLPTPPTNQTEKS